MSWLRAKSKWEPRSGVLRLLGDQTIQRLSPGWLAGLVDSADGCECDGSLVDCPHLNRLPPPIDDYGLCVPVSDQVYDNVVRPTGNFARPATVCPGVAGAVELPFDVIRSQIRS